MVSTALGLCALAKRTYIPYSGVTCFLAVGRGFQI